MRIAGTFGDFIDTGRPVLAHSNVPRLSTNYNCLLYLNCSEVCVYPLLHDLFDFLSATLTLYQKYSASEIWRQIPISSKEFSTSAVIGRPRIAMSNSMLIARIKNNNRFT